MCRHGQDNCTRAAFSLSLGGCEPPSPREEAARSQLGLGRLAAEKLASSVACLRIVRAPESLDQHADDLGDADHAEQILAFEHGQVADLALAYQAGRVKDVVVQRA